MKRAIIIILCCVVFIISCTKEEIPTPEVIANTNIFSIKESVVTNNQSIQFTLPSAGVYTLSLVDKETEQVVGKERFTGIKGENIRKIYTNSLQISYLYLILEDNTKTEIGKTTIIIK